MFTAFGLHNPFLKIPLPDHAVFPLSKEAGDGLDLDYTALMIGTQFAMDARAFDYVTRERPKFLLPMSRTLQKLKVEGLLDVIDYGEIVKRHRLEIDKRVSSALDDPLPWFRIVQNQWNQLNSEFVGFHQKYGSAEKLEANTIHSGVLNYVESSGSIGRQNLLMQLEKLLAQKRSRYNQEEIGHIREIIRPLIAQIFINDLVRSKESSPFLDWDDAKEYYEKLYALRWDDNVDEIKIWQQASILFDAVVPDLKPNNIDEVIRFIRDDKAVESMRSEIQGLLSAGQTVSKEFLIEYSNKAIQRELALKSKMKKYRLGGTVLTSFIPGGGLLQELGLAAAQEKVEDIVSDANTAKMRWYYALQREAVKRSSS
jgi:hypothetical protein